MEQLKRLEQQHAIDALLLKSEAEAATEHTALQELQKAHLNELDKLRRDKHTLEYRLRNMNDALSHSQVARMLVCAWQCRRTFLCYAWAVLLASTTFGTLA